MYEKFQTVMLKVVRRKAVNFDPNMDKCNYFGQAARASPQQLLSSVFIA